MDVCYGADLCERDAHRRMMKTTRQFVTTKWLANRWGLHEESVRRILRSGRLRGFKVGPMTWRIPYKAVLAYEAGNVQEEGRVTS